MFRSGIIKNEIVRDAMMGTDRALYVPHNFRSRAYDDNPLAIGYNATISAPHMHAYALENCLKPILNAHQEGRDAVVLDVGCGSGYLLGAFGRIGKTKVVGLEHIKELYEMSLKNFKVSFGVIFGESNVSKHSGRLKLALSSDWLTEINSGRCSK